MVAGAPGAADDEDARRGRNLVAARRVLDLAGAMDVDALVERLAPGVVVELPFAPLPLARRHDGIEAAEHFLVTSRDAFSTYDNEVVSVHPSAVTPDVVVAEVVGRGVAASTGRAYEQRYVLLLTFDLDGRVVRWREYYDPDAVRAAFDIPESGD